MHRGFAQILSTGVYASIQDRGRLGFEQYGVPKSGFLMKSWINVDCINAIEFFGTGLAIRFSHSTHLTIFGKGVSVKIDRYIYHNVSVVTVRKGAILKVIKNEGNIAYLTIEGGWQSEWVMNSYSQMKGITLYDRLYPKMVIPYIAPITRSDILVQNHQNVSKTSHHFFAMQGPEFIKYNGLINEIRMTINPNSNRQAISFDNCLAGDFPEILSSYTPIGTIQITTGGKVFILSNDGQTTGGYFRWGFITQSDLEKIYELPIGTEIVITLVSK
ncbi:MAG TPA: hypothetical protein PKD85_18620 [Saprospiraceae bacterium]|nr:hypothetical protein [Saprospiraceae bacterium]